MKLGFSVLSFGICLIAAAHLPAGRGRVINTTPGDIPFRVIQPQPTCHETVYRELVQVRQSRDDIRTKHFLVKPWSLAADRFGNVFALDQDQYIVIKYSPELKCMTAFGRVGQGPGEFGRMGPVGMLEMTLQGDELLVGDRLNGKVLRFDLNGTFRGERKLRYSRPAGIRALTDPAGNYYIAAREKSLIDVYDRNGNRSHSILGENALFDTLFMKPEGTSESLRRAYRAIDYEMAGDKLLIYVRRAATLYVWQAGRLQKTLRLWPQNGLALYRREITRFKKRTSTVGSLGFGRMFLDGDDPRFVYIRFFSGSPENRCLVYRYDLSGRLHEVLYIPLPVEDRTRGIECKRNGLFYALGYDRDDNPIVLSYKEK